MGIMEIVNLNFTALMPPRVKRTRLEGRMVAFSITMPRYSIPVRAFIITLNRVKNNPCTHHADDRKVMIDDIITGRMVVQEFMDVEENSSYSASFTAMFKPPGDGNTRTTTIKFVTPEAGKIH